jgi:predicted transcriptional regulator
MISMSMKESMLKDIDKVLEHLGDFQWHGIEEIKQKNFINDKKLIEALHFLEEQALITVENEKMRITPKGSKFLELPC